MNISEDPTLGQLNIGILAYADNIAILGDNMEIVKKHYKKLMEAASKVGLIINDEKTKYMKFSRRDRMCQLRESIEVEKYIFYRVSKCMYFS